MVRFLASLHSRSFWCHGPVAALLLGVVLVAAYGNTFRVPFIFDDTLSIPENLTLRGPGSAWFPPGNSGITTAGRPILNVSLAINYALGRSDVRGYHAANLLIHFLASLTLFGLIRRTTQLPRLRERFALTGPAFSLAVAALWALHPLQTESVTYIVQRAESLVGLFYLLTVYCFVRAVGAAGDRTTSGASFRWQVAAVGACLLGMGSKEVMVSAPIIVLLFDRTFVSGSFAGAWRQRRGFYLSLAATWILLAICVISTGNRGGSAGLGTSVSSWQYALTQCHAISHYLRLVFWPVPLVLDYGIGLVEKLEDVIWKAAFLLALVAGTLIALKRRPEIGFLGVAFFALLAPSSSIVPVVTQTMAEHRMYLALAPVIVFAVLLVFRHMGRFAWPASLIAAAVLAFATYQRNHDYRSERSIWEDTVAKAPTNSRAWCTLGVVLLQAGETAEANRHFDRALELNPRDFGGLVGRGNVLAKLGRQDESIPLYQAALRLRPDLYEAHYNLGKVLLETGRHDEAVGHLEAAVRAKPGSTDALYNLGNAFVASGRIAESVSPFLRTLDLEPDSLDARNNLGLALLALGHTAEALPHFQLAVQLSPRSSASYVNLGRALTLSGRPDEGRNAFERAVALDPTLAEAQANLANARMGASRFEEAARHYRAALDGGLETANIRLNLGLSLVQLGNVGEAIPHFVRAAALEPLSPDAHYALANALAGEDRLAEAVVHYEKAAELAPASADAWNNLGVALARLGRFRDARGRFERALRADPNNLEARDNLRRAEAMDKR